MGGITKVWITDIATRDWEKPSMKPGVAISVHACVAI